MEVPKKVGNLLKFEEDLTQSQVQAEVVYFEPELVLQILLENLFLLL